MSGVSVLEQQIALRTAIQRPCGLSGRLFIGRPDSAKMYEVSGVARPQFVEFASLLTSKQTANLNRLEPEVHFDTLALIDDTARRHDLASFLVAVQATNWEHQPAEKIVSTVNLALSLGAFGLAGRLASEGTLRHANDAEIRRMAQALAPAQVLRSDLPADPGIKLNRDWLKGHGGSYRGRWVAIRNGQLLGHADSLRELTSKLPDRQGVLLTRVP